LVMKDPQRAAALAESRSGEVSRRWAAEATACRWADTDPGAATQWALNRLEGAQQTAALKGIPWSIERTQGAVEALRWWQGLPVGEGLKTAFDSLVEISQRSGTLPLEHNVTLLHDAKDRGLRSESLEVLLARAYAEN